LIAGRATQGLQKGAVRGKRFNVLYSREIKGLHSIALAAGRRIRKGPILCLANMQIIRSSRIADWFCGPPDWEFGASFRLGAEHLGQSKTESKRRS